MTSAQTVPITAINNDYFSDATVHGMRLGECCRTKLLLKSCLTLSNHMLFVCYVLKKAKDSLINKTYE